MKIAGLILAGGQATRMGGVDKGLLAFEGHPLVQVIAEKLRPQVDGLWVSANRNLAQYQALGYPVFTDDTAWAGFGPLSGIASFLAHLPAEYTHIQIVPCDTPNLPEDLTVKLAHTLTTSQTTNPTVQAVYPQTTDTAHYACALVTRAQLSQAQMCLTHHQRSLQNWLTLAHAVPCDDFANHHFINLNESHQWIELMQATEQAKKVPHDEL